MADDNKNPLDVLEELLNESSNSGGANVSASGKGGSGDGKPPEPTEEELAAQLEQKRVEFEDMEEKHEVIDEQKLTEQREAILGIKDTQAYQARVEQDSEKKQDEKKKVIAGEGFEIDQLDHTKV